MKKSHINLEFRDNSDLIGQVFLSLKEGVKKVQKCHFHLKELECSGGDNIFEFAVRCSVQLSDKDKEGWVKQDTEEIFLLSLPRTLKIVNVENIAKSGKFLPNKFLFVTKIRFALSATPFEATKKAVKKWLFDLPDSNSIENEATRLSNHPHLLISCKECRTKFASIEKPEVLVLPSEFWYSFAENATCEECAPVSSERICLPQQSLGIQEELVQLNAANLLSQGTKAGVQKCVTCSKVVGEVRGSKPLTENSREQSEIKDSSLYQVFLNKKEILIHSGEKDTYQNLLINDTSTAEKIANHIYNQWRFSAVCNYIHFSDLKGSSIRIRLLGGGVYCWDIPAEDECIPLNSSLHKPKRKLKVLYTINEEPFEVEGRLSSFILGADSSAQRELFEILRTNESPEIEDGPVGWKLSFLPLEQPL